LRSRSVVRARFNMKTRVLKSFGSVCLSVLLGFSSVAWAFDDCLRESGESSNEQLATGNIETAIPLNIDARSVDKPAGAMHCVATYHAFDVIAQSSSIPSLRQLVSAVPLATFLSNSSTSTGAFGLLGGHPHLGGFISSSPPSRLSRHLVLSVFLI